MTAVLLMFAGGLLLLIFDFAVSRTALSDGLQRNAYGGGSRIQELEVSVEEKPREKIAVEVSEQAYAEEEVKSMFQRCIAAMDEKILGENPSLDHVESDLHLITEIPGVPVEISWELDHYDVMNIYGQLQEERLREEGTVVALKAVLTYTEDPREQALYTCSARVFPRTLRGAEKQTEKIRKVIKMTDKKTQKSRTLTLPGYIDGKKVSFYPAMETRGIVLAIMAVVIGLLLGMLEKQNQKKESVLRSRQMQRDYPEIISKLTLLMGAGMTVKRAWKKVVDDYESGKQTRGIRYAYEEMKQTCYEMSSGVTEAESYERFGRRCNLQEYIKLGALLSQNLRKGTKGLNQILKMEAIQSFEERKARAKRLGEEAGTKLLAPMFFMLAVVLVIVIVPAFLSIQM